MNFHSVNANSSVELQRPSSLLLLCCHPSFRKGAGPNCPEIAALAARIEPKVLPESFERINETATQ